MSFHAALLRALARMGTCWYLFLQLLLRASDGFEVGCRSMRWSPLGRQRQFEPSRSGRSAGT